LNIGVRNDFFMGSLKVSKQKAQKGRSEQRGWTKLSDKDLLKVRICDLGLTIAGTQLERRIQRVNSELERKNLSFKPHYWLSDEWFSADGIPGVAIPFYLAHPRLQKLEKSQVLDVEGGSASSCLKILRHEVGHALDNAYRLRRRRRRQQLFGKSTQTYPDYYSAKPFSRSHVLHLDSWYAQSHPDEDFAETFAVWLTPDSKWKKKYEGWRALKKLEYIDELMKELRDIKPLVRNKKIIEPVSSLKKTLEQHYEAKKEKYGAEFPSFYDRDLRRLFSSEDKYKNRKAAAVFLRSIRSEVRETVSKWTGAYQYTIDQVLREMISRCSELKLRLASSEKDTRTEFTALLTVQTLNFLHSGRRRLAL